MINDIKPGKYPAIVNVNVGESHAVDIGISVENLIDQLRTLPPKARVFVVTLGHGHATVHVQHFANGIVGLFSPDLVSYTEVPASDSCVTVAQLIEQLRLQPLRDRVIVANPYGNAPPRACLFEDGTVGLLAVITMTTTSKRTR